MVTSRSLCQFGLDPPCDITTLPVAVQLRVLLEDVNPLIIVPDALAALCVRACVGSTIPITFIHQST